jgi:DNA-binding NarL/FixJ family response regulator
MAIRVLIADDQAMVRAGFRMILDVEPDMEVVGEAADGDQALALARRARPDLVVMDIRMPVTDGIEATKRLIAELDPPPRVLMVTTFDDDESLYAALRAGAGGFLLKNAPPEQLVDAVRQVAAGDGLLAPALTRRVIEELARTSPASDSHSPETMAELTTRELEVLRLMARGLSNAEIAETLVISIGTAKTHVARILMKLGLRDRVQAVVLAYESGLVQPQSPRAGE